MLAALRSGGVAGREDWLPVLAGLLVLYVPAFYGLATVHWQTDEGAHGPIVLGIVLWLIWLGRDALFAAGAQKRPAPGFPLILAALALYVVGRSVDVPILEIGSLVPLLAGVLLAMRGWPALKALWFPVLFVVFMIPLPGILVDAVTGPLKQWVSVLAEQILYATGYPVARSGVVITIGQYQLLVADACAGLHSMFSLSALGLLFMRITGRESLLHNAVMLASILPIAFVANIVRVLLLMLITFHLGDEAGQGFLHGATGILLLLVALIHLFALDALLARVIPAPRRPSGDARAS